MSMFYVTSTVHASALPGAGDVSAQEPSEPIAPR